MTRSALLLALALAVAGCHPAEVPPPAPAPSLRAESAGWPSVTAGRYPVPSMLMLWCIAPTPERIAAIRADEAKEHGPHREHSIVVRVNPTGIAAFRARTTVPAGTVVVKQKYAPDAPESAEPVAIAAMTKRQPGYDPAHGDWEYAYEEYPPGAPPKVSRGRIESCIDCHHAASDRDYLYRPYLAAQGGGDDAAGLPPATGAR